MLADLDRHVVRELNGGVCRRAEQAIDAGFVGGQKVALHANLQPFALPHHFFASPLEADQSYLLKALSVLSQHHQLPSPRQSNGRNSIDAQ